ncbi:hypothetical protein EK904_009762 [Melospiza melodia maxima]|nr:hypothetical protein EK904_009762 [Melospiza melodia maxima]
MSHTDVNLILLQIYDTFRQQQQLQQQNQTSNLQDKATLSSSTPESGPACMHILSLGGDMSEEDMLQAAMNMSLESVRNHLNLEEEK